MYIYPAFHKNEYVGHLAFRYRDVAHHLFDSGEANLAIPLKLSLPPEEDNSIVMYVAVLKLLEVTFGYANDRYTSYAVEILNAEAIPKLQEVHMLCKVG